MKWLKRLQQHILTLRKGPKDEFLIGHITAIFFAFYSLVFSFLAVGGALFSNFVADPPMFQISETVSVDLDQLGNGSLEGPASYYVQTEHFSSPGLRIPWGLVIGLRYIAIAFFLFGVAKIILAARTKGLFNVSNDAMVTKLIIAAAIPYSISVVGRIVMQYLVSFKLDLEVVDSIHFDYYFPFFVLFVLLPFWKAGATLQKSEEEII